MSAAPPMLRAKKLAIHAGANAEQQVATMLARQNPDGLPTHLRTFPGGAIGCVGGAGLPAHGNVCVFTGAPINGPDPSTLADADAARRMFAEFDGAFTAVFLDAAHARLVVATDCLGMQPLYFRHDAGGLSLMTETKALAGEPDLAAWGAFVSIGHPIGARSLMRGLARAPPASILCLDLARQRLALERYWDWPEASDAWREFDFLAALERDIRGYAALGQPGSLLLSGGFDSRLLLFLLTRAGLGIDALGIAHADEFGDADGRLAASVAKLACVRFRKARPAENFFSSRAYVDYLCASNVAFPSLDLFIAKVAGCIDSGAVWDGLVPGFVFMPLHQPEGGFTAYLRKEIRGPDSPIWRAANRVFKPEVAAAMHAGFHADLEDVVGSLPQDMHGLARFVIENRSRNRAAMNPLMVYANRADAYTPGLSREFMRHAATLPFDEKQHARFYRTLLAKLDARALSVPFVSGGELLQGAGSGPAWWRESVRGRWQAMRARHPRAFMLRPHGPPCSAFLDGRLFDDDDPCLAPRLRETLAGVTPENYLAWKLLFHWKAWQWLHQGRLRNMLGAAPVAGDSRVPQAQ